MYRKLAALIFALTILGSGMQSVSAMPAGSGGGGGVRPPTVPTSVVLENK